MLRGLVHRLAASPRMFDALRWTLEAGYRGHHRVFDQTLPTASGSVIDVGCGTGVFAAGFDPKVYLGVDLSPAYIAAAARKHPRHRFAVMDARRLELSDESQSRCFIAGMLHHLSDDDVDAVLSEVRRVLQPGGRAVIWEDVPTRRWWNVPGRIIHALDMGDAIRTPDGYRRLIERHLIIEAESSMSSGCMDYAVFQCRRG